MFLAATARRRFRPRRGRCYSRRRRADVLLAATPTGSSAQDTKLDFKDVLIRPKRSTLRSRKEVRMERSITFKHSGRTLTCVPVVVANMDTVGTFEMAKALCE